jgi:DNA-binding response OmpR family regulator
MMKGNILLIEGKRTERSSFLGGLTRKGFHVTSVPSGNEALKLLEQQKPHLVVVDADSMRTSGKRICLAIRERLPRLPIILVIGSDLEEFEKAHANEVLALPFTTQKLINRIRPFLPMPNAEILKVGPIELDIKHRLVRCRGEQARLTPRLVTLLRMLIDKKGEVILREELFKKAWDTNYTGDTRTLDVHISWLRIAIGDDPRKPKLLKTLRGVGYRLDVD